MRLIGALIALALLTSCASWSELPAWVPPSHLGPQAETKAQCTALGGTWDRFSTETMDSQCAVPTSDGGKVCTDHSQCEGLCVAVKEVEPGARAAGQCRSSYNLVGRCDIRIVRGRAENRLCID